MNPVIELAIFAFMAGLFAYRSTEIAIGWLQTYYHRKAFPSVQNIKNKELCRLHTWNDIMLAVAGVEPRVHKVCTECGLVFGTTKKLNKPALGVYHNHLIIRETKRKIVEKTIKIRQIKRDIAMNNLIKGFITCDTSTPLQQNIEFLQNFFRKSVIELDNIDSEITKELDRDTNDKH